MKNSAGRGGCYPPRPKVQVAKPSEICRILHIPRKPNSIIALLFIQNIFFAQTCKPTRPQVFSVNGSIIFDVNGSIICSRPHF